MFLKRFRLLCLLGLSVSCGSDPIGVGPDAASGTNPTDAMVGDLAIRGDVPLPDSAADRPADGTADAGVDAPRDVAADLASSDGPTERPLVIDAPVQDSRVLPTSPPPPGPPIAPPGYVNCGSLTCASPSQCCQTQTGWSCATGTCPGGYRPCDDDGDCGSGHFCYANMSTCSTICLVGDGGNSAYHPLCRTDADCPSDRHCAALPGCTDPVGFGGCRKR
jgi:hypothetical protein